MHRLLHLACVAALGVVAGTLLGVFWLRGGMVTFTVAVVGMMLTSAAPVLIWSREERSERRREEAEDRRVRRARFDTHAEELDQQVFRHLQEVRLTVPLAEIRAAPGAPPGSGLSVPEGPTSRPLEELPNWTFAVEHLRADPAVGPLLQTAEAAAATYYAVRERTIDSFTNRYTQLLLSEFGFETRLEGNRFDDPPWYDVRAIVSLSLAVNGPIDRTEFSLVDATLPRGGEANGAGPQLVFAGESAIACLPSAAGDDVEALVTVVRAGRNSASANSAMRALGVAEQRAQAAVRHLADAGRRYSDRILIEHAGSGSCQVCRSWAPP